MLSVLFASTFALAGCTSTPGGVSTPPAGNSSSEVPEVQGGQLNIFLNEQGYGSDWLRALGAKFQELFGTQVLVVADPSNSIGTDAIGNETSQYDLVFSGAAITQYVSKGQLVNINDVSIPSRAERIRRLRRSWRPRVWRSFSGLAPITTCCLGRPHSAVFIIM